MLGRYEQFPPFRFQREKVFSVVDDGIEFQGRLYKWNQIEGFRDFKGIGFIEFSDGARCRIHMRSFRRMGERRRGSWFGHNATYRELSAYWLSKRMEAVKPPRMKTLESELSRLREAIDSASGDEEVDRLGRKFMRANTEYLQLQLRYPEEMGAEFERIRQRRRKKDNRVTIIAVVLLVALGLANWLA